MSGSEADILRHLGTVTAPIDVRELARALDTQDIGGLNYGLGNLVRKQRVKRHHSGDGVLRYTLPDGAPRTTPQAIAVHPAALLTGGKNKPGVSASKVLAVISPTEPRTKNEILKLTDLTDMQVQGALQALRRAGLIKKHGQFTNAQWTRITEVEAKISNPPTHVAPAPATEEAEQKPDALPTVVALDLLVLATQAALDAYIESKVEADVYRLLVDSANAARTARDQFQAGHNA